MLVKKVILYNDDNSELLIEEIINCNIFDITLNIINNEAEMLAKHIHLIIDNDDKVINFLEQRRLKYCKVIFDNDTVKKLRLPWNGNYKNELQKVVIGKQTELIITEHMYLVKEVN